MDISLTFNQSIPAAGADIGRNQNTLHRCFFNQRAQLRADEGTPSHLLSAWLFWTGTWAACLLTKCVACKAMIAPWQRPEWHLPVFSGPRGDREIGPQVDVYRESGSRLNLLWFPGVVCTGGWTWAGLNELRHLFSFACGDSCNMCVVWGHLRGRGEACKEAATVWRV